MAFCINCGKGLRPGAAFCDGCGTPVGGGGDTAGKVGEWASQLARQVSSAASSVPGESVVASWAEEIPSAAPAPSPSPAPTSSPSPAPSPARAPKKKRKVWLIVPALLALAGGGYSFLALWPAFHTNIPPISWDQVSEVASLVTGQELKITPEPATPSIEQPSEPADPATSQTSEPAAGLVERAFGFASKPANSTADQTSKPASFSTDQVPRFEDFDWLYSLATLDRTPSFGAQLTSFSDITGGWKCMFFYDSAGTPGEASRELLNVFISGDEGNFSVVMDLYAIEFGNEVMDEVSMEDIVLNGSWDSANGTLQGTGTCSFSIDTFYSYGDAQYALGRMMNESGEGAAILMVRP